MKIYFPHIAYTVYVKDIKGLKERLPGATAQTDCINRSTSIIWLKYPIDRTSPPTIAHEIIHVIRNILLDRNTRLKNENEHMAYIAQHIMGKVLNLVYIPAK